MDADKWEIIERKKEFKARLYLTSGGKGYLQGGPSGPAEPPVAAAPQRHRVSGNPGLRR